jgi:serine protease Do
MTLEWGLRGILVGAACSLLFGFQATKALPEIVRSVSPSVVLIKAVDQQSNLLAQGSGFVVATDAFDRAQGLVAIATTLHVVEGAFAARVWLTNGEVRDVSLVLDSDRQRDLALILVLIPTDDVLPIRSGDSFKFTLRPHFRPPPLKLGNSDGLRVGQHVVAIGNPEGLAGSVSDGILSALRQTESMKVLQITAPISPGSSGCPILNDFGEVIGVAQATIEKGQNLNFAVPVNYLKPLIAIQALRVSLPEFNAGVLKVAPTVPLRPY